MRTDLWETQQTSVIMSKETAKELYGDKLPNLVIPSLEEEDDEVGQQEAIARAGAVLWITAIIALVGIVACGAGVVVGAFLTKVLFL